MKERKGGKQQELYHNSFRELFKTVRNITKLVMILSH